MSGEAYTTPHEFMHLITGQGFTRHGEMASNIGWLGAFGKDVWPTVATLLGVQARFFDLQKEDSQGGDLVEGNEQFRVLVMNEIKELLGGNGDDFGRTSQALLEKLYEEGGILRTAKMDGLFEGFNWIDPLLPLEASDLGWGLKFGQPKEDEGLSLSSGADRELNYHSRKIDADIVSSVIKKNKRIDTLRKERIKDLSENGYGDQSKLSIEEQEEMIQMLMNSSGFDGQRFQEMWNKKPYPVLTDMEKAMNIPENIIPLSEIEKEAKKLGITIRNPRHVIDIKVRRADLSNPDLDAYEKEYKRLIEKERSMWEDRETIGDWSDLEIRVQDFSFEILNDDIELNETNNSESERQKIRENKPDSRPAPEYNLRSFDSLSADEQEELITLNIKNGIRFNQYFDLTRKFNDRAEFDYEYFEEEGSIGTRIRYSHELLKKKPRKKTTAELMREYERDKKKRENDGLSLSSGANKNTGDLSDVRGIEETISTGPINLQYGRDSKGMPKMGTQKELAKKYGKSTQNITKMFKENYKTYIAFEKEPKGKEWLVVHASLQAIEDIFGNLNTEQKMSFSFPEVQFRWADRRGQSRDKFKVREVPLGTFSQSPNTRLTRGADGRPQNDPDGKPQFIKYQRFGTVNMYVNELSDSHSEYADLQGKLNELNNTAHVSSGFSGVGWLEDIGDGDLNVSFETLALRAQQEEWYENAKKRSTQRKAYAVMVHEVGHSIDDALSEIDDTNSSKPSYILNSNKYFSESLGGLLPESVSAYGNTDSKELFAEAFSAWFLFAGSDVTHKGENYGARANAMMAFILERIKENSANQKVKLSIKQDSEAGDEVLIDTYDDLPYNHPINVFAYLPLVEEIRQRMKDEVEDKNEQ
jgi:hypothetical protein